MFDILLSEKRSLGNAAFSDEAVPGLFISGTGWSFTYNSSMRSQASQLFLDVRRSGISSLMLNTRIEPGDGEYGRDGTVFLALSRRSAPIFARPAQLIPVYRCADAEPLLIIATIVVSQMCSTVMVVG